MIRLMVDVIFEIFVCGLAMTKDVKYEMLYFNSVNQRNIWFE